MEETSYQSELLLIDLCILILKDWSLNLFRNTTRSAIFVIPDISRKLHKQDLAARCDAMYSRLMAPPL